MRAIGCYPWTVSDCRSHSFKECGFTTPGVLRTAWGSSLFGFLALASLHSVWDVAVRSQRVSLCTASDSCPLIGCGGQLGRLTSLTVGRGKLMRFMVIRALSARPPVLRPGSSSQALLKAPLFTAGAPRSVAEPQRRAGTNGAPGDGTTLLLVSELYGSLAITACCLFISSAGLWICSQMNERSVPVTRPLLLATAR